MKIKHQLLLIVSGLGLSNVALSQDPLSPFHSWSGHWKYEKPGKTIHERWSISSDGQLRGDSWHILQNGDSVYAEKLHLYASDSSVYYCPTVPGQAETRFQLIKSTNNTWVFYNAENEFPKYIRYVLKSPKEMEASIGLTPQPRSEDLFFFYVKQ
jgi:hypothetical protein